jgi:hypothetical protein
MPKIGFSVQVGNFRSFYERASIEIRPLTVLVGRNSCGKSSITRPFPLMAQSLEERASAPVLWYGRDVDFGSFANVLPKNVTRESIEIGFKLSLSRMQLYPIRFARSSRPFPSRQVVLQPANISYLCYLASRGRDTIVSGFDLEINNDLLCVRLDEGGTVTDFKANGQDVRSLAPRITHLALENRSIFPFAQRAPLATKEVGGEYDPLTPIDEIIERLRAHSKKNRARSRS